MFSQDMPSRTKCVNMQQDDWRFGAKTGTNGVASYSRHFHTQNSLHSSQKTHIHYKERGSKHREKRLRWLEGEMNKTGG